MDQVIDEPNNQYETLEIEISRRCYTRLKRFSKKTKKLTGALVRDAIVTYALLLHYSKKGDVAFPRTYHKGSRPLKIRIKISRKSLTVLNTFVAREGLTNASVVIQDSLVIFLRIFEKQYDGVAYFVGLHGNKFAISLDDEARKIAGW